MFHRFCRNKYIKVLLLSAAVTTLSSCAGRSVLRQQKLAESVAKGDFLSAIEAIRDNENLYGRNNQFLYHMDIGVLFHYAGMYDSSNTYLMKAADVYDELFVRSVTNEAASILVNDNMRPYRSKPYELVHLHAFAALNFLAQGRSEDALVEVRRMQIHFNEWDRKDRRGTKYTNDGMFHLLASMIYQEEREIDNAMISLFKAVRAYQEGPVPLPEVVRDYAYHMLVSSGRASDTALLKISAPKKGSPWDFESQGSEIVVVSYAGRGPSLRETVWAGTYIKDGLLVLRHTDADGKTSLISMNAPGLPASEYQKAAEGKETRSGTTFHIKVALPALDTKPTRTNHFTVGVNDESKTARSVEVNNIDLLAKDHLEENWGTTLGRTVIRVVLRTISSQRAKERMRTDNPLLNLVLNLGTDVATSQMERADVRSCFLLPGAIHITRIPVEPGTHDVEISAHDRNGNVISTEVLDNIQVRRGEKRFVFKHSFK